MSRALDPAILQRIRETQPADIVALAEGRNPGKTPKNAFLSTLVNAAAATNAGAIAVVCVPSPSTPSKYRACSTEGPAPMGTGVRKYASKKEARRAVQLEQLRQAGEILWWIPQVRFPLDAPSGQTSRAYVADFLVLWTTMGTLTIEDTKGFRTPEYKRKLKAMRDVYNITITEL